MTAPGTRAICPSQSRPMHAPKMFLDHFYPVEQSDTLVIQKQFGFGKQFSTALFESSESKHSAQRLIIYNQMGKLSDTKWY